MKAAVAERFRVSTNQPSTNLIIIIIIIVINSSGISFPGRAGLTTTDVSVDARETMSLFQRVSLAVQRYNSVAFKGTFTVPTELDYRHATPANLVLTFVFNPRDLYYPGYKK